MPANKKKVAAVLGVLEFLRRERETAQGRERTVSAWALAGRQEQMQGPEHLMQQVAFARRGVPGVWRRCW